MTYSTRVSFWHWLLTLGGLPLLGVPLSWFLWIHRVDRAVLIAAVFVGVLAAGIDYARRGSAFCALVGTGALLLVLALTYGLLIGVLVISCATGGCPFD
jgi:hypothetical protein